MKKVLFPIAMTFIVSTTFAKELPIEKQTSKPLEKEVTAVVEKKGEFLATANISSKKKRIDDVMVCFGLTCKTICFSASQEDVDAEEDWYQAWLEWEEAVCGDD